MIEEGYAFEDENYHEFEQDMSQKVRSYKLETDKLSSHSFSQDLREIEQLNNIENEYQELVDRDKNENAQEIRDIVKDLDIDLALFNKKSSLVSDQEWEIQQEEIKTNNDQIITVKQQSLINDEENKNVQQNLNKMRTILVESKVPTLQSGLIQSHYSPLRPFETKDTYLENKTERQIVEQSNVIEDVQIQLTEAGQIEEASEWDLTGKELIVKDKESDEWVIEERKFTESQLDCVLNEIQKIQNKNNFGLKVFKRFLKSVPKARQKFPFLSPQIKEVEKDPQLQKFSKKVFSFFFKLIRNLKEDNNQMEREIGEIRAKHFYHGISRDEMTIFAQIIINVLRDEFQGREESFSKEAWELVIKNVIEHLQNQEQQESDEFQELIHCITVRKSLNFGEIENTIDGLEGDKNHLKPISIKEKELIGQNNKLNQSYYNESDKSKIKAQQYEKLMDNVDFHHKMAFAFEKSYRMSKNPKLEDKLSILNLEIIDTVQEYSEFIESDHMTLFYCLYFCIYYNNNRIFIFLRNIINKVNVKNPKIEDLLQKIDVYGISRLRSSDEQINQILYHQVLYQAFDDDLRVVYSQIIRNLRFIQLRDQDAIKLLNTRDYNLIKLMFSKYTAKINLLLFFKTTFSLKSSSYRRYNQAYFEEIVINNEIENRVAQNYRERFLVNPQEIFTVFMMYCKEDYDDQFIKTKKDNITSSQFLDLFIICLRNDSFKVAFLIYSLYIDPQTDFDMRLLDILIQSIGESVKFHEMKLFFLHEHFNKLTIEQMSRTVDIYFKLLTDMNDYKRNPMMSQYNTIKISLLIYRICWRIEQKQIYSLFTKCKALQQNILDSLSQYLEQMDSILVLLKMVTEPILSISEHKDSLDIMNEMEIQQLLKHPVLVEIINLVNESRYSVKCSALNLSATVETFMETETFSEKSLLKQLTTNIVSFGDGGSQKQSSLMYHLWKRSIMQRQMDAMNLDLMINISLIVISLLISKVQDEMLTFQLNIFGKPINNDTQYLLININPDILQEFCTQQVSDLKLASSYFSIFTAILYLNSFGGLASLIQLSFRSQLKENVQIELEDVVMFLVQTCIGIIYLIVQKTQKLNYLFNDTCSTIIGSDSDLNSLIQAYTFYYPQRGEFDLKILVTVLVFQCGVRILDQLRKVNYLGDLIILLTSIIRELIVFIVTISALFIIFLLCLNFLGTQLTFNNHSIDQGVMIIFNVMAANSSSKIFSFYQGKVYYSLIVFIFKIFLISLVVAIFINKYQRQSTDLEAIKRFKVITLRNQIAFDKQIGAAIITFFPINIPMIPFLPLIITLKSTQINDFVLKIQYTCLILIYLSVTMFLMVFLIPLLFVKVILNSVYITMVSKREHFKGEKIINLLLSLFVGPIIIILSLLVDLFTLPAHLLKESSQLEHKYQNLDKMTKEQGQTVLVTFQKLFYSKNSQQLIDSGFFMTLEQLMEMHLKIFKIVDNLHDFICKGVKDAQEALGNVQDYNMTKKFTAQCGIPQKTGRHTDVRCEIPIIANVAKDIFLYNYIDIILRKSKMNILRQNILDIERGQNPDEKKVKKLFKLQNDIYVEEEDDLSDDEIPGDFQTGKGPDGITLRRNIADLLSSFWIHKVALSFTDVLTFMQTEKSKKFNSYQIYMQEVENRVKELIESTKLQFVKLAVQCKTSAEKKVAKVDEKS